MTDLTHQPVLLQPTIDALNIKPDGVYIDGTFGRGGHAQKVLDQLGPQGRLIAIDRDPTAVSIAKERFETDTRFEIHHSSFEAIEDIAKLCGVHGQVAGVMLDLGTSSPQLDDPDRGFSFLRDGPLDMRMDPTRGVSAAEWIATSKEAEMVNIFKTYGEERFAKRIAKAIVTQREIEPIVTTAQLAKIVSDANPKWEKHKHPATRVFQAIRICINEELSTLSTALAHCVDLLAVEGRLVVISFHSLEDRIVKRFLRQQAQGELPKGLPVTDDQIPTKMKIIGKAIVPTMEEVSENPRARSAVLRIGEKLK